MGLLCIPTVIADFLRGSKSYPCERQVTVIKLSLLKMEGGGKRTGVNKSKLF